jgi:hypothetical protein
MTCGSWAFNYHKNAIQFETLVKADLSWRKKGLRYIFELEVLGISVIG